MADQMSPPAVSRLTAAGSTPPERVLVVEDDAATRAGLAELLSAWGFEANAAADGRQALDAVASFRPSIVISDLVMPQMDGMSLLRALEEQLSEIAFVMLTAQGTVETAVQAMKVGAYDYLTKPVDPRRLRVVLDKIVERQQTLREVRELRRQLLEQGTFGRLVGRSQAIRRIYRTIEQAAPTTASVLIWGESGTGKELVAQTLHQLSPRAHAPYVAINCAAIPEALLESEIFGHEKGAFTGASDRRLGCFELAHRGTLFLDEVAEMMPATQVKLLRVLQERTFRRLGGRQEISVDVRVVAATNADPIRAVETGKLREDLFYRLNVFTMEIPPLRSRPDDIPLLVQAFVQEFGPRVQKTLRGVTPDAMRVLEQHSWPGNVRELRNVIERASIVTDGEWIGRQHLPPVLVGPPAGRTDRTASEGSALVPGMTVDQAETELIRLTLAHTGNNKTRAAEILGISLKTLHNKLNRLRAAGEPAER